MKEFEVLINVKWPKEEEVAYFVDAEDDVAAGAKATLMALDDYPLAMDTQITTIIEL